MGGRVPAGVGRARRRTGGGDGGDGADLSDAPRETVACEIGVVRDGEWLGLAQDDRAQISACFNRLARFKVRVRADAPPVGNVVVRHRLTGLDDEPLSGVTPRVDLSAGDDGRAETSDAVVSLSTGLSSEFAGRRVDLTLRVEAETWECEVRGQVELVDEGPCPPG